MSQRSIFFYTILGLILTTSCERSKQNLIPESNGANNESVVPQRELSEEFKSYWFDGTAEITSYSLSQERYGELREGSMVAIFVTEDFDSELQVKADSVAEGNIKVLKLNKTKKFLTGIYPYSIMSSIFSQLDKQDHAIKVTNSVQEWCGQVFAQLNNRDRYEINSYSYFQSEADEQLELDKHWLEDELWNLIRINPESLPTGELKMIPSFEYSRLKHKNIDAYNAIASLKQGDSLSTYGVRYPDLQREIIVYFNSSFPFEIEKWEETNAGWLGDTTRLKTTAVKMKRIKTPYWRQNSNKDSNLRDSLALDTSL